MTELVDPQFRSNFDVDLVQYMGSDEMICRAARVSTLGAASIDSDESTGLLKFLMRNRHGSPFEHGSITFRITAPIFVWREFMRHRIGFSYNEESGRYKQLDGVFYIPPPHREFVQIGKPGEYTFHYGSRETYEELRISLKNSYAVAWHAYQKNLDMLVAKEVARMCLPVATYSTAYVTCNPRSLMAFLSLRTQQVEGVSTYRSTPQWEISQVANHMEDIFGELFPETANMFNVCGRVGP